MAPRIDSLRVLLGAAALCALGAPALAAGAKPKPAPAADAAPTPATTPTPTTTPPETTGVPAPPAPSPEEAAVAKYQFAEAVRLEASGNLALAATTFERAYDADPTLAHAGANAGLMRERLGDDAGARAVYSRVLSENPGFLPAARNLARIAIRRREIADAEKDLRGRLAHVPASAALHVALSDLLLAGGRLDEAEEVSRKALKLEERNVSAMVSLAAVYERRNRHELAKMVLDNARQVDERDPCVWNRLGFVDLALGSRPQALEDFRNAAALGPDYAEAHANYGAMLADAEDFVGAAAELEIAVKYAPGNALVWLDLGNALRGTQQFDRAEAAYRKALELDPALTEVHFNLGVLYLDGDKPGLAPLARMEQAVGFFDAFEQKGGKEPKLADHRKDAAKAIDREKKRLAREERDRLRREAEAKKKEEEARREAEAAARKAAEDLARKQAEEAARKAVEGTSPAAPSPAPSTIPAATESPAPERAISPLPRASGGEGQGEGSRATPSPSAPAAAPGALGAPSPQPSPPAKPGEREVSLPTTPAVPAPTTVPAVTPATAPAPVTAPAAAPATPPPSATSGAGPGAGAGGTPVKTPGEERGDR